MDLVIAITEDEYQKIRQGKKTMLVRTLYPLKLEIKDRVYMHVRGLVRLRAVVNGIFDMRPQYLWQKFSPAIDEKQEEFNRRFTGKKVAVGISFKSLQQVKENQIGIRRGYTYICASIR